MLPSLTEEQQRQLRATGADIYRHLPIIHSVALRVPARNLGKLAALPFVQHLSADCGSQEYDEFTTVTCGATSAWAAPYNLSGSGVTVAVVDSPASRICTDLAINFGQGNKASLHH